jgi:hypothetical protein
MVEKQEEVGEIFRLPPKQLAHKQRVCVSQMRSRAPNTFKQDSVITRADPRFETLDSSYDREVVFCQCERCDKLAEGGKWITTRVWKEQHGGEGPLPPGRSGRVKMIAKKGTVAGE